MQGADSPSTDRVAGQGTETAPARLAAALDRWRGLRRSHRLISFGCACGMGGAHVSLAEFERDLIDFLAAKWAPPAGPLLGASEAGLEALLLELVAMDVSSDTLGALIDDMEKAINSFAPRRTLRADEA